MSEQSKAGASAGSPLSSTRQLLDELDALMQRMMALPVGDAQGKKETSSSSATSVEEPALPEEATEPDSETASEPARTEADSARPKEIEPPPSSYYYEQTESEEESESESDAAEEEETPAAKEPAAEENALPVITAERLAALTGGPLRFDSEPIIKKSRLLEEASARTTRWWLWPFTLVNRIFDIFTYLLGPLGSWLREPGGRLFLGWFGLALLLAAMVLQVILWVNEF